MDENQIMFIAFYTSFARKMNNRHRLRASSKTSLRITAAHYPFAFTLQLPFVRARFYVLPQSRCRTLQFAHLAARRAFIVA